MLTRAATPSKYLNRAYVSYSLLGGLRVGRGCRNETRLQQDAEWSSAVADGRAHISHREATQEYASHFRESLIGFDMAEMLVTMTLEGFMTDTLLNRFQLFRGKEFILRNILEFAFPGHGPLIMASINRRKLAQTLPKRDDKSKSASRSFRLCVRKRPVLSFEKLYKKNSEEQGIDENKQGVENYVHLNYDAASTATIPESSITFHDGRLARNGKRLTMTHSTFRWTKCLERIVQTKS